MKKSNQTGGKSHKKFKKSQPVQPKQDLLLAKPDQIYALVKNKQGGTRLSVLCSDNKMRSAIIKGNMYKKVWINQQDVLLCDLFDDQPETCYVLHKYSLNEARQLKKLKEIPFEEIGETNDHIIDKKVKQDVRDMFPTSSESFEEPQNVNQQESDSSSSDVDIKKL
jgi:translation initiation factor 1A